MSAVAISNKMFMFSLILLMLVLVYHGFGWKRLFVARRIIDRNEAQEAPNPVHRHGQELQEDRIKDDSRLLTVLRNPLLYVALAGIAVSIIITL